MIHLLAKYLYRDFQIQILTILQSNKQFNVICQIFRLTFFCYNKKTNFIGVTELHLIFIVVHKVKNPTKPEANLFAIYIRAWVN